MRPKNVRGTESVPSGPRGRDILIASIAALAVTTSCAGGGGGSSDGGDGGPSFGEDGGDPAPPISNGATVTMLETKLPWLDTFVLRGNIPVPPGTYPRSDGLQPFTIYDYDGTPLETQTNVVTRYPKDSDGAEVVEVMARVRRDPNRQYDSQVQYEVRQSLRPAAPDPGAPGVEDLGAPENLTPNVLDLLTDPQGIEIATYDVFGNKYVVHPLDGTGTKKLMRHGKVVTELRVFQTMLPVSPDGGPQGTLPHFFGVHSYVSSVRGDDIVFLDVRFNNGHSGKDQSTSLDDPLDRVYFDRIDVTVPSSWFVDQGFEDPFFGNESTGGGKRTVSLVNRLTDGTKHYMRWQGQMHRRLVLSTAGLRNTAQQYVEGGAGQAFCVRGRDPGDDHEYWSWWNRGTARYFPQSYQLPRLDHVGNLLPNEESAYYSIKGHLENGTSTGGNYPIASGNLGWAHPYGVSYGGMTGGNEVFLYDGVKTAAAKSRLGTQMFKAYMRMHTDRQATALYDVDGQPASVEDWVVANSYVPFEFFLHPNLSGGDPFGVNQAPQFQIQHVVGTGKQPSYEPALRSFDAHDYQHYVRYTRAPKVLLWLTNDSLAKDDLLMAAEVFHFAYHEYDNSQWGSAQESGMRADQLYVQSIPGIGFGFGRGEAWGIDAALAAYAAADVAWREKKYPWFQALANLVADGQGACNGFIQSNVTSKNLNGLYRTRQQIEQSITENMLQGLRETVFRGRSQAFSDLVRDTLASSLNGFISDMVFVPGCNVPPSITAIGPLNVNLPVWCSFNQMPADGWSDQRDSYQDWCSFAWGYELTGDLEFMDKALTQFGYGNSLHTVIMGGGTDNIENRSALLALAQRLNGDL